MKVLRKILKMDTTFMDRSNTNEKLFNEANRSIKKRREAQECSHIRRSIPEIEQEKSIENNKKHA